VYKLAEMDERFHLVHRGSNVLDLGCAPGSWLEYFEEKGAARILGIDQEPVLATLKRARVQRGDVLQEFDSGGEGFDLVVSDLAPKLSGIRDRDDAQMLVLVARAREIAHQTLVKGGAFVCKLFDCEEAEKLIRSLKGEFHKIHRFRPKGSREGSREFYLVALGRRKAP